MNTVEISGGYKYQRKLCDSVINYTIKKLLPRLRTLEINVELTNILDDATGYCMIGDNNREFYIEIDKKLNLKDMVLTICHEMVHVKQYVRNELGINDNHDGQNYFELPYEKEAYRLQETLLKQFKEVYNYEMA